LKGGGDVPDDLGAALHALTDEEFVAEYEPAS
jgi:hypothetical protein